MSHNDQQVYLKLKRRKKGDEKTILMSDFLTVQLLLSQVPTQLLD